MQVGVVVSMSSAMREMKAAYGGVASHNGKPKVEADNRVIKEHGMSQH